MPKILIVDDHALVRLGISRLLEDIPDVMVVAQACSGEEALQQVKLHQPDIVLLDMMMPGMGGLEVTRRMSKSHPQIKVIAVTACVNEPLPSRVLQAGAHGYLSKECSFDEMTQAINKVSKGERYLSPEIAQQLALKSISDPKEGGSPFEVLSERELQVMLMIASGLKVQEISERLCISSKTVNSYRYRMFSKLKVKNDVELIYLAMKYKLIDEPVVLTSAEG